MAPSVAYTRASATLVSPHPSVLRSLASHNAKSHRITAVRSLWWWGKHGTWSSSNDENNEERFQRHRKIMMHRYSRAVRRRAMWDRDDNFASWVGRLPDSRLVRKWGACRTMSSTDHNRARPDDRKDNSENDEKFWAEFHQNYKSDYDALKAAIDRAIAKDPYATLFGTRLQSPPTENNSSWISWLFNRSGSIQNTSATQTNNTMSAKPSTKRKIEIEVLDKKPIPPKPVQSAPLKTDSSANSTLSPSVVEEYKYDPISGRKILQSSIKLNDPPKPPQTFLETLFSEHGAEPDKPVKQHQVHGYKSTLSSPVKGPREAKNEPSASKLNNSVNSRAHEYRQLRAATLGNSIDTAAEFGGKFEAEPNILGEVSEERIRTMPEREEDAPLFSGTTYASKADQIVQGASSGAPSWLEKEGFQEQKLAGIDTEQPEASPQYSRLEPSFERMQSTSGIGKRKFVTKLQPAIDRVQLSKPSEEAKKTSNHHVMSPFQQNSKNEKSTVVTNFDMQSEAERVEDIDLLRASDIRAATKTMRTTRQEAEQAKARTRNQLEDSFDQVHRQQPEIFVPETRELGGDSSKLTRSIEDVHKHADQYPDGIVAKTMRSMGMIAERFKDYKKPPSNDRFNLTERLEFESGALDRLPTIYNRPAQSLKVTSPVDMQLVQKEMKARTDLTESLRLSSKDAHETKKKQDAQIEQLADGIRQIYESEHGPIDLSPATASTSVTSNQNVITTESSQPTPRPTEFEAEQARFLSEVGKLSKDVQSVKQKTAQLETELKNNLLASDEASIGVQKLTAEAKSYIAKADSLHACFDKQNQVGKPHPLATATVKPGVPRFPAIERHTQVFEPRYVQLLQDVKSMRRRLLEVSASLHDLQRSRTTQESVKINEIPVESQKSEKPEPGAESCGTQQTTAPVSPYLVLVYNKSTGEVDQNAMDRLPWSPMEKVEKANPIRIMGNLNYPAAFVTHFVELEKAGYELSNGGGDMLIFQRKTASRSETEDRISEPVAPAPTTLRNTIAAEEASAQPEITETIAQPKSRSSQQAATVLDDIPTEIPTPGPAPPTAPPTNSLKKSPKTGTKVRRQEQVFSGTIPLRKPRISRSETRDEKPSSSRDERSTKPEEPFFARTTRSIKRGVLGVAAFGATVYTIGVVTEGIGAQAQVEGDETIGPRRKIVMPMGQRPGIYSTESSRIE